MSCTAELIGIVEEHTASNEAALCTCAPASSVRTAMADHADIRRRLPRTDPVLADLRMARALRELGTVPVKEAVRGPATGAGRRARPGAAGRPGAAHASGEGVAPASDH